LSLTVTCRNEVNQVKLGSERARAESMKVQKKKVGDMVLLSTFLAELGK